MGNTSNFNKNQETCHPEFISGSQYSKVKEMLKQVQHDTTRLAMTKKKYAFTLAEVLITLGIIGVVAAMTLPALIQHYKKVEYSSRLKKFYSSMNQAILLSEVTNGSPAEWNKVTQIKDEEGKTDYNANGQFTHDFFMKYLAPYIKYTNIEQGKTEIDTEGNKKNSHTKVYFPDGTTVLIANGSCFDLHFDVNGLKKPNQQGKDIFIFLLCHGGSNSLSHCGNEQKYFCSYVGETSTSRTDLLDECKLNSAYCSGLLMRDGWEFKKDYPFKL